MNTMINLTNNQKIFGIALMLGAMLVFTLCNVILKKLAQSYPMTQIIFFRGAFAFIPCFAYLLMTESIKSMKETPEIKRIITIGIFMPISFYCLFSAIGELSLANAQTIAFSSTIFITLLSGPILSEKITPAKWIAVALGLVGVAVMSGPNSEVTKIGLFYAISFAIIDAIMMINYRIMGTKNVSPTVIASWTTLITGTITGVYLLFVGKPMPANDFLALAVFGIGCGIGQLMLTAAYKFAPASTVSPMIYSAVIWTALADLAFWGVIPSTTLLIGALIIVSSGMYIIHEDTKKNKNQNNNKDIATNNA